MTRFIAKAAIMAASLTLMFANYWFTFGLWPKSWTSFVLCGCGSIAIIAVNMVVDKESE